MPTAFAPDARFHTHQAATRRELQLIDPCIFLE